jgi:hypothetical protein
VGLVNLTTNLKSLRYGKDQLGGGYSGQPYIKASIPEGFNDLQLSNNDFILRGGALAARDSATDVLRLGKMFTDTKSPNGALFVAKQNLLSRTAVRTQASTGLLNEGVYTPLSTLAEAGLVAFGGHVNKQGLNPFAGIGSGGYSDGTYLQALAIQTINIGSPVENRLVQLFGYKILLPNLTGIRRDELKNTNNINTSSDNILISYQGGPGSILGVGKTNINVARTNNGGLLQTNYDPVKFNPKLGTANFITTGNDGFKTVNVTSTIGVIKDKKLSLNNERNTPSYTPFIGRDFRSRLLDILKDNNDKIETTILSKSPDYATKNIESRVNIGGTNNLGPGNRTNKNLVSYTSGSGIGPVDKINALPIYSDNGVRKDGPGTPVNDLVKFRIAVIDNSNPSVKTFIHFRAFIDNFSDSYNANWNPVTYLGRGENFYTYSNYTRNISMGWTVAAQSKEELIPMYKKLNYLASSLTPYYTPKGYMTGNLVQLTVGGYLYEQVGIINSITYDIPEESPWEIGINDDGEYDSTVKELPHIIRVTNFSFTPIQDFIPSIQPVGDGNGTSRYISLNDGADNNSYKLPFKILDRGPSLTRLTNPNPITNINL